VSLRPRLIAVGADLVRESGPSAVTSVAIGARAGLSQSALYRYVRNIDELRALSVEAVVAQLDEDLARVAAGVAVWHRDAELRALVDQLVTAMGRHGPAFEQIDRWRFEPGPLGEGIRAILRRGRDGIAALLEAEWHRQHPDVGDLSSARRTTLRNHAQLVQDDIIGVARLVRTRTGGGRRALSDLLFARVVGGWQAFRMDMDVPVPSAAEPQQEDGLFVKSPDPAERAP
jgi:AcrR family transcriptional regulator